MNKTTAPRLLIAGTSSGSGKTTITCGILQALKNRGLDVASFKCGPDYIDPMFHEKVIDTKSNNLDPFFMDENTLKKIFIKYSGNDLSIIEGVMGYFDGTGDDGLHASTYEVATYLDAPTILIINGKGMSTSILPIIKGFVEYQENSKIKGIIINHISEKTYQFINKMLPTILPQITLLGYVPKLPSDFIIESRHLGLITASEITNLKDKLEALSKILEKTIDFDKLIKLANEASILDCVYEEIEKIAEVRVAYAEDEAFQFYYNANLDLLKNLGATLIPFSPLHDKTLPPHIDGILFGGGYPELHAVRLSKNEGMLKDIKNKLEEGIPFIAECGGFMYLNKSIEGIPLVGFYEDDSKNQHKLTRFGYVSLTCKNDCLLGLKGEKIKGHEFHYYDVEHPGNDLTCVKQNNTTYEQAYVTDHSYAGYPHLYFYSNMECAKRFIIKSSEWRAKHARS